MCVRYRATGPDQNYSVPSFETSEVSGELIAQIAAPVGENNCFKGLISSYSGPCENSELELLRIVRKSSHARLAWPATKRCPDEKLYKIPRLFAWSSLLPTAQLTDLLLWSLHSLPSILHSANQEQTRQKKMSSQEMKRTQFQKNVIHQYQYMSHLKILQLAVQGEHFTL